MRYGCRPVGKPAFYDAKFPATYNARRDNLEGFWRRQFCHTHAVALWWSFFEHVERAEQDTVLEFAPNTGRLMAVACLYSHWTPPKGSEDADLWSFAPVTDHPPPKVALAGHDRCVIPLSPEGVDAWLRPEALSSAALLAVLDERERFFYDHRVAA